MESLMASVGGTTASNLGGPNYGELVVHLKPRSAAQTGRRRDHQGAAPEARRHSRDEGRTCRIRRPSASAAQVTKSLYQFSMQSPDKEELYAAAEKLAKEIEKLPGVEDVTTDVAVHTPQVNVTIDRDKAAAMSVNANLIENALYDAYGPRWVSTIYGSVNEYKVLLELEPRVSGRSAGALAAVLQEHQRQADPARHAGQDRDRDRAADHQPLRAAARRRPSRST